MRKTFDFNLHQKKRDDFYKIWCAWKGLNTRCKNPRDKRYEHYGGRGIKVLWLSFDEFYRDMKSTYRRGLQIDRINNNGNYCKENCRWATVKRQQNNKRNVHIVTHRGRSMSLTAWANVLGVSGRTIRARYANLGWRGLKLLQPVTK